MSGKRAKRTRGRGKKLKPHIFTDPTNGRKYYLDSAGRQYYVN